MHDDTRAPGDRRPLETVRTLFGARAGLESITLAQPPLPLRAAWVRGQVYNGVRIAVTT